MKHTLLRIPALILVLLMLSLPLAACANTGTPLLTLKADGKTYTYSVNLYELQLSTAKAAAAVRNDTIQGIKPTESAYWDKKDTFNGKLQNIDDYYCQSILEECRYILVSLCLFDRYDLSLSEAKKEEIEEYIGEFIKTDGDGSENKLNSVLSDYGINVDMLREHCINSAKVTAVQSYLYNQLGDNIKTEYLEENYVHFDQLFLSNENYIYVTDKNGDEVYYDEDGKTVLYKKTDFFGSDEKGNVIYYTDATKTHISYDTENGKLVKALTEDGNEKTESMTPEELEILEARAKSLLLEAQGLSPSAFASLVDRELDEDDKLTDGYYLQKSITFGDYSEENAHLDEIMEKLKDAKVGDVVMVESAFGYHIVMKQKPTAKAWENSVNDTWFATSPLGTGFEESLTRMAFEDAAKDLLKEIKTDDAVLEAAKNMKAVKPNYYYY